MKDSKAFKKCLFQAISLFILLLIVIFGFQFVQDIFYARWPNNLGTNSLINLPLFAWDFIKVAVISSLISGLGGMIIGIFCFTEVGKSFRPMIDQLTSMTFAIPSIAVLMIMVSVMGFSMWTAVTALVLQGMLPVIVSTISGLDNIPKVVIETGAGLGMNGFQRLTQIQLPMAMPIILSGLRICVIMCIGTTTLAYYAGAGGLGQLIFAGYASYDMVSVFAGTVPIVLIALLSDRFIRFFEIKLAY